MKFFINEHVSKSPDIYISGDKAAYFIPLSFPGNDERPLNLKVFYSFGRYNLALLVLIHKLIDA